MKGRRDFLRLVGAGMGATVLSSCGGNGGGGGGGGGSGVGSDNPGPLPNGMRFHRVTRAGDTIAGRAEIDFLPGAVNLDNQGGITFLSVDPAENPGLHQLHVDFGSSSRAGAPTVVDQRNIVAVGDPLPGGLTATRLGGFDSNGQGDIGCVLSRSDDSQGLYTIGGGRAIGEGDLVIEFGTELPNGQGVFLGSFGDVDLHDGGTVLVVAHHATDGPIGGPPQTATRQTARPPGSPEPYPTGTQALWLLPSGRVGDDSLVMLSQGDLVPNADAVVRGVGLVDLDDNGYWVAQAFGDSLNVGLNYGVNGRADDGEDGPASMTLCGNTNRPAGRALLYGSSRLAASRSRATGEVYMGPRVSTTGGVAQIVHITDDRPELHFNGRRIIGPGNTAAGGEGQVLGLCSPVVGADGTLYYLEINDTPSGMALVAYNGHEFRVLLSRGDTLSDGGPAVETIMFGGSTEQVDRNGRLVFCAEFTDGSMAIVVGIPV